MLEDETEEHSAPLTVLAVKFPAEFLTIKLDDFGSLGGSGSRASTKRHWLSLLVQLESESQYPGNAFPCVTSVFAWQATHRTWELVCLLHFTGHC